MPNLSPRRSQDPSHFADPFADIRRELDQVFERFMGEGFMAPLQRTFGAGSLSPQLDVRMENGKMQLDMDLPGVNPNDVDIMLQDGILTIKGERREERTEGEGDAQLRERRFGRFERRIQLPDGVDEESLDARFENGVLAISARLKKGMEHQRRIRIAGASGSSGSEKGRDIPGRQSEAGRRSTAEKSEKTPAASGGSVPPQR